MRSRNVRRFLTLLSCLITLASALLCRASGEPWWHNPQLEWKPFTGLPTIDNPNGFQWRWDIQERSLNGTPKFFAQLVLWNNPGKFLVANASASPLFVEATTNLPFAYATSAAMVKWTNAFDELFLGTQSGIWRFDEASGQFVSVWYWTWDPTYIASMGNAIWGSVANFGSQSGYHIWSPQGDDYVSPAPASYQIWADPISARHGVEANTFVRLLSTNASIWASDLASGGGEYSLDGGLTRVSPIGARSDGLDLYLSNCYGYSATNVIVHTRYSGVDALFLGNLGGTLYPLSAPSGSISTLFYSPSTRLLIAGNATYTSLYYTVLPPPDALAASEGLEMGFSSNSSIKVWGQSNVYCRIETATNLSEWVSYGSILHLYTQPVAVPMETILRGAFFRGVTLPTNWASLNNSLPDPCAEHDNVSILSVGNVPAFDIAATHPTYTPSNYLCYTNFDNCPNSTNTDYLFPNPATWNTDFAGHWSIANRKSSFWRPEGMDFAINGSWIAGATNIHQLDIGKNIPGTSEWPGFFTIYSDGYVRLIPFPPVGQLSICMGSSILVGPADPSDRPFADIASLDLRTTNLTLFLTYRSGGSASIDFSTVTRTSSVLKVAVNYPTDQPFCTVRSMYVANGNSDCDTVIWTDGATTQTNSIFEFQGGSGTNWLFSRRYHSIQRDSAPDIRITF